MRKDTAAFESRRAAAESALDELTKRLQRAATHRRVRLKASTARHGESAKEGEEEGEEVRRPLGQAGHPTARLTRRPFGRALLWP